MLVHGKALGSQGYSLIKPHVLANDSGFSNDDTCPVINEKTAADLRSRMNFDTRRRMGDFRDHAGDQRSTQAVQFVREAVMGDGSNTGIADQYLVYASRRRIPLVCCLNI